MTAGGNVGAIVFSYTGPPHSAIPGLCAGLRGRALAGFPRKTL